MVLFARLDESGMFCLELDGNILFVSHEVVTSSWTALEDGLESSCLMIFSMMYVCIRTLNTWEKVLEKKWLMYGNIGNALCEIVNQDIGF